jgi:broad specificity phosphatase PhoE
MRSPATTILLVRHGHTAGNASGSNVVMSGWTDLALSAEGLRQARAVAACLARGPRLAAVYTSPLQRAVRTADEIALACGAPRVLDPGLREINCGDADGLTIAAVQQRYPSEWARNLAQDDPDFRWPRGESYRELRARCWAALQAIAVRHREARVAAVTHAGVISQVLGRIAGESCARWEAMRPRNASLTEIAWDDGGAHVLGFDVVPAPERAAGAPAGRLAAQR